ncbi:hypothetical protein SF83666_c33550 [Sinorhizobium fredii CCBAU 83666]|nr:hypothetical protein SF83666_c33550 [Sinorhizobium fredii CCBAU 83666]
MRQVDSCIRTSALATSSGCLPPAAVRGGEGYKKTMTRCME